MSAAEKVEGTESIALTYDLFDLPSAQHKAGLAGLLVLVESLKAREQGPLPEIALNGSRGVTIILTQQSLGALLDDIYDANKTETESKTKRKNSKGQEKPIKRTIEKVGKTLTGKTRIEKWYVYDDFQPKGAFFKFWLQDGSNSVWLKLWREVLWSVLRAQPATRGEYENRANDLPAELTAKLWDSLVKAEKDRQKGKFKIESIAGSLFVGAQDINAEQVPFVGQIEHNLLLHFWQLCTPIFVPQVVDLKSGKSDYKDTGFVLAIPEVSDLHHFVTGMIDYWKSLNPERAGYRPRNALIDLPEEGGLEFIYHLARSRMKHLDIAYDVAAVELYHLHRRSDSVRMLVAERLVPNERVLAEYENIRGVRANPYYKSLRIQNLLGGNSWYCGVDALFSHYPWEYFIKTDKSPRLPVFGNDVKRYFTRLEQQLRLLKENNAMNESDPVIKDDMLARRIYRLIGEYVNYKTDARSPVKHKDLPRNSKGLVQYDSRYREAREKVTSDAFLAMRGRRAEDFVEYFTGTICSVPHFVQEAEYIDLTQALIQRPDTVKNLSMLALSACSWLPGGDRQVQAEIETQEQEGEAQ